MPSYVRYYYFDHDPCDGDKRSESHGNGNGRDDEFLYDMSIFLILSTMAGDINVVSRYKHKRSNR